ncbi:MAG TPA: transcriptional regulator [Halieaceae bacterium]|nr:transcriptional regulator [Halieaceae bacterium]
MPIYEYQCQACGELTEALQKLSDAPLTRCPACGEDALRKKVSAAAFRLKGGGWYETDFKTGSKKNLAGESDGKADGKADGKKEGKADAKTDSKKDAGSSGKAASDKSKGGNSSSAA